jgi:hypothetical protein
MRKISIVIILLLTGFSSLNAQKYAVHFTNKHGSPYSLSNPLEYISQKALDRREKFNIELTETDLPVNPDYIAQVKDLGANIIFPSKWINCVLISVDDEAIITKIEALKCVEKVVYVAPKTRMSVFSNNHKFQIEEQEETIVHKTIHAQFYGEAYTQINQINGIPLHEKGYQGEGIIIAVLDAGFANADIIPTFKHLFDENKILLAVDIVEPGNNIYEKTINAHGTSVLSCMAAYSPNKMIGTAPKASYCLIRTEDARTEYLIEEYNWVIGAEMADSIGADALNSSLNYSTYNDPAMNHTYRDMDGKTTIASIGAQYLSDRGVFAVISAGNSGQSDWPWIGTPADVDDVLTVGAIDKMGNRVEFSSIGPNAAGARKPNVMALGSRTTIINSEGEIIQGSGTSFSSPIVCGMVACLLQACPEKDPKSLKATIEASSSQHTHPSDLMGYGIPDFNKAFELMPICRPIQNERLIIYPNPTLKNVSIRADFLVKKVVCYDLSGKYVFEKEINAYYQNLDLEKLSKGVYIIYLYDVSNKQRAVKIIKE